MMGFNKGTPSFHVGVGAPTLAGLKLYDINMFFIYLNKTEINSS